MEACCDQSTDHCFGRSADPGGGDDPGLSFLCQQIQGELANRLVPWSGDVLDHLVWDWLMVVDRKIQHPAADPTPAADARDCFLAADPIGRRGVVPLRARDGL